MSKYIVDIPDSVKMIVYFHTESANEVWATKDILDDLEQYTPVDIEKVYDKAYSDGYNKGFKNGKAVIDKGCDGCECETHKDGTCIMCSNNYMNLWKEKNDKIEIGDEVKSLDDSGAEIEGFLPWIVTIIDNGNGYCQGIDNEGKVHATKKVKTRKTGRHFDIVSILEAMKHD